MKITAPCCARGPSPRANWRSFCSEVLHQCFTADFAEMRRKTENQHPPQRSQRTQRENKIFERCKKDFFVSSCFPFAPVASFAVGTGFSCSCAPLRISAALR